MQGYAGGHGRTVGDFQKRAAVTAEVLGRPGLSVGERIQGSVEATSKAVGCNTNLGIVLLCAPLAHAALAGDAGAGLRAGVSRVCLDWPPGTAWASGSWIGSLCR